MTTIAYKDGELAFDSRITDDGALCGEVLKGGKSERHLAAACGDADVVQQFLSWVASDFSVKRKPKISKSEDFTGLTVDALGRVTEYSYALKPLRYKAPFYAIGSGADYAKGAMAAGKSAYEAVVIASELDTATGRPIHSHRIQELQRGKNWQAVESGKAKSTGRKTKTTKG